MANLQDKTRTLPVSIDLHPPTQACTSNKHCAAVPRFPFDSSPCIFELAQYQTFPVPGSRYTVGCRPHSIEYLASRHLDNEAYGLQVDLLECLDQSDGPMFEGFSAIDNC